MPSSLQPSFSKGEIPPALYGRVDTNAYTAGLAEARNATIHSYGGVSNRAGLQFISWAGQHTAAPRLLKFEFNNEDTYVLEFGNLYMRVIRNDAYVTETVVTITGASQLSPVVVTAGSHGYANGDEVVIDGVIGMTELNGRRFIVANKNPNDFELTDPVDGTDIDGLAFTAYSSAGEVGKIFEIVTPYAQADLLQVTYTQDADTMVLTHEDYTTQELTRTGHAAWAIADMDFNPSQSDPTGVTVTPAAGAAVTERYQVTAISADDEESLPGINNAQETITDATTDNPVVLSIAAHPYADGDEIEVAGIVGTTELNGRRFRVTSLTAGTISLQTTDNVDVDGTGYTAYSSGGTANRTFTEITNSAATKANTVAWTAVAGAVRYAIYNLVNGLYGLVGESETVSFLDANVAPDTTEPPPKYSEPFFDTGNQPAASGFYEQRRVLGGTLNKPNSNFFSKTGFYSNFTKAVPVQVDDAIEARLVSQKVNQIRHYVAQNDLLVFTDGAEWRVDAGADVGFSIETIRQKPQSSWGSSYRQPISAGNTTLFVQPNDVNVRSIGYSFSTNSYQGTDLSILASHLLRSKTITDWAFARYPDPVVYMVRSDGDLMCMTFDQDQEVIAWSTWDTDGKFEAVTAVQSSPGSREESAYFVVRRKVGGNTVRYVEKLHSRNFEDIRDAFFIDSALSYDAPVDITGVSLADPCVVTAIAHGFSNGNTIDIFDIEWETDFDANDTETQPVLADGAPQLNTRRFLVANKTNDTFELTDEEGTDIDSTAYNPYVEGGTVRVATTSINGMAHLAGKTVQILADGNVEPEQAVASDGTLTLTRKFSRVHAGLKYVTDIRTLNIEVRGAVLQGKMKKISRVVAKVERTRGIIIGPDESQLTEIPFRENERMNDPTEAVSGTLDVILKPSWNTNGQLLFRQRYPLPFTLLSVAPDFEVGDR